MCLCDASTREADALGESAVGRGGGLKSRG